MNGILLIHGFCGARDEVLPLYNQLAKEYIVEMPLLRGHESDRAALARAKHTDWLFDTINAYEGLSEKCDNITVIGFSMGGLLACRLYEKHKFDRLITINTPIYYWDIKRILKNLLSAPKKYFKKYFTASTNKPFNSLLEFVKLLSSTKKKFSDINCPTLIIQVQDDDTVNVKSGDYIYKSIKNAEIYKPEHGGHIILTSEHNDDVFNRITKFL